MLALFVLNWCAYCPDTAQDKPLADVGEPSPVTELKMEEPPKSAKTINLASHLWHFAWAQQDVESAGISSSSPEDAGGVVWAVANTC